MGTRAQVKVLQYGEESPVYLYRHWDGDCLIETVFASIASERGQSRATDSEYLARIIFEDMVNEPESVPGHRSYLGEETGYGIGTSQHGDIEYLITVDTESQTVLWEHTWSGTCDRFTFAEIVKGNVEYPKLTDEPYEAHNSKPAAPQIIEVDGVRYIALLDPTPEQQAVIDEAIALLAR